MLCPMVYVLECVDNCLYVGVTLNMNARLAQHWAGQGARWTRAHRPLRVARVVYNASEDLERSVTLELMAQHGWERVRGGPWCSPNMQRPPAQLAELITASAGGDDSS